MTVTQVEADHCLAVAGMATVAVVGREELKEMVWEGSMTMGQHLMVGSCTAMAREG